jgi:lipoprotein-anchoring transpeptidase ErfK/SrfK
MTGDELERRLRDALDAQARASVGDSAMPPAPRFAERGPRSRSRLLAPLAAAAAVVAVVGSVLAVQYARQQHETPVAATATATWTGPTAPQRSAAGAPVRIQLLGQQGATYGVGMPVIALFSRRFSSAAALQAATTVIVDGKPVKGAWYFERATGRPGFPVEGHLRPEGYWPAHSAVEVALNTDGVSAGAGSAFTNGATLKFNTGPRTVAVVNDQTHRITVTQDDKPVAVFPVSLGAPATPTMHGVKVVMDKGDDICMSGPGYQQCGIRYTQRLTYSGEYLHAAPWNTANIKRGIDSSNGCTNLLPDDAGRLYKLLKVGDVVEYPNASGPAMRPDEGYGDWNVPWDTWLTGGLIPTR